MNDPGGTTARVAVGLFLWTLAANVIAWWAGAWDGLWDELTLSDPGAVMAEVFNGLLVTSGLWLVGAVALVFLVLFRTQRK